MAVYSRTTSNTSSNSQLTNQTSTKEPMKSMELGQIIVHSLEAVSEAIENKNTPATSSDQITKAVIDGINKSDSITKEDFEKSITEAINKSNLAKTNNTSPTKLSRLIENEPEETEKLKQQTSEKRQEYWQQKKFDDDKKRKDKQDKLENDSRKRKEKNYTQGIERLFTDLNKFSKNPLAGVVNAFEGGIKRFFNKTLNTTLGDVGNHMKKGTDVALAPIKATGKLLGAGAKAAVGVTGLVAKGVGGIAKGVGNVILGGVAVGSLIKDRMMAEESTGGNLGDLIEDKSATINETNNSKSSNIGNIPNNELKEIIADGVAIGIVEKDERSWEHQKDLMTQEHIKDDSKSDELVSLIQSDTKDSKKDRREQKKEQVAQGKILKSVDKNTDLLKNLTLIKFGAIVAIIGGIAAFLPQIVGMLAPFINNIPWYLDDMKTKIGLLFTGENSIGNQIKWAGIDLLQRLGEGMAKSDNSIISGLGKGILSGTASGAQEELAEQFRQSESYKNLLKTGMSEEDVDEILASKPGDFVWSTAAAMENSNPNLSKKVNVNYTNNKGKSKSKNVKLSEAMFDESLYEGDEKGKVLYDKLQKFWDASTAEEIRNAELSPQEFTDLKKYLSSIGMAPVDIEVALRPYVQKSNLVDWWQVMEDRAEGKLKTDTGKLKAQAKAKDEETFLQQQALGRIEAAQSGGVSALDFATDTAWETNPYLKEIKDDYMSKYATELSKGEKILMSGMEAKAAGQRMAGNLVANVTGHNNPLQSAETKLQTSVIVSTTGNESGDLVRR